MGRGQADGKAVDILYGDLGPRADAGTMPIILDGAYQELIDQGIYKVSIAYQGWDDFSEFPEMNFFDADGNDMNAEVPREYSEKLEAALEAQLEKQAVGWNTGDECVGQIEIDVIKQESKFDHSHLVDDQEAAPFKFDIVEDIAMLRDAGWEKEKVDELMKILAEMDVDKAYIKYSGTSDEGNVDGVQLIQVIEGDECPVDGVGRGVLRHSVGDLVDSILRAKLGSWGDGIGSQGVAILDPAASEIDFDHYENTRESSDSPFSVGALEW